MDASFKELGPVGDFPVGSTRLYQVGTQPVCVLHLEDRWVAFEDYCPHRAGPLSEGPRDAETVTCPWHGARFSLRTGALLNGPCRRGLHLRPVTEQSGTLYVGP